MRCDECGRPMGNAELWQLAGDPHAPASSSMRHLCWECREKAAKLEERDAISPVVSEAAEIVRQYESSAQA